MLFAFQSSGKSDQIKVHMKFQDGIAFTRVYLLAEYC